MPDEIALEHEWHEEPSAGWPFREIWLPPEVANAYLDTLKVLDSHGRDEIPPDLVGK
jgi:hypothetical protein